MRRTDRILGLLLAVGVLTMVFVLRSCRGIETRPGNSAPTEMPTDL